MSEVDWSAVIGSLDEDRNDVTSAYQSFITRFQQIYNYCFPISLQNSRLRTPRKEWMTAGLLTACRKKNILYRKFIKNLTNSNRQTFVSYSNKFQSIKTKAIREFYSIKFKSYHNNMKKTWNLITQLLNRRRSEVNTDVFRSIDGKDLATPGEITKAFNNYFANIGRPSTTNLHSISKF